MMEMFYIIYFSNHWLYVPLSAWKEASMTEELSFFFIELYFV